MFDVTTLTDGELAALLDAARAEHFRRRDLANAVEAFPEMREAYLDSIGRGQGEAWQEVTGYENAYPEGWTVTHNGSEWVSLINGNTLEPGVSGWREVLPENVLAEWQAPAGYQDAYEPGAIVTHQGHVWRNDHTAGNAWEPGTTGSQWADLGPNDEYEGGN